MFNKDNKEFQEEKVGFFRRRGQNIKKDFKSNINYDEIAQTTGKIKNMAKSQFDINDKLKNAKVENFENVVAYKNLSDLDLISLYKNYSLICYISLFFLLVCIVSLIYFMIVKFSILNVLSLISISLVCLANAFKYSFRAFQIKHRKLCSVDDYLRKKDFLPTFKN